MSITSARVEEAIRPDRDFERDFQGHRTNRPSRARDRDLSRKYTAATHYTQRVHCGNLFLEGNIGNGINMPSIVSFAGAEPDAS